MPEVVPMESKLQTPEIAHNISSFFLISSCWNRCQLPFGWFPVLLGIHGVDGVAFTKREWPRAQCCRVWCAASSHCSCMSPLDHKSSKSGHWQDWQVTVFRTWGHWGCRGEDPSPAMQSQPTFAFGPLLLCEWHLLITRCTEQPDNDRHRRDQYTSLFGCCLFETRRELEGKGSMIVCVQRRDILPLPKHRDYSQDKSYLLHNIHSATHEAERSLLLWTANF